MLTDDDRQMVDTDIKQGWGDMRTLQGDPTIDILRYSVADDDDALVLEGDSTLVPGMSSLDAAVFPRTRKRKRVGGLIEYVEADMVFVIYDVDVLLTDLVQYASKKYQVIKVDYNSNSGRCVIVTAKV